MHIFATFCWEGLLWMQYWMYQLLLLCRRNCYIIASKNSSYIGMAITTRGLTRTHPVFEARVDAVAKNSNRNNILIARRHHPLSIISLLTFSAYESATERPVSPASVNGSSLSSLLPYPLTPVIREKGRELKHHHTADFNTCSVYSWLVVVRIVYWRWF